MKTVPLYGKKAAGRVAQVDDGDYEFVMRYRWYVSETPPKPNALRRAYPSTNVVINGKRTIRRMHQLIMGRSYVDHIDHDGLNNQRSNLRPASQGQNLGNQRPQKGRTSQYKGVSRNSRQKQWRATIKLHGENRDLGAYVSELEAAYAYDAAARQLFGEFAYPNFPEGPTPALRDEWRAAQETHDARMAEVAVERERKRKAKQAEWREGLELETRICEECGAEYQSRSTRSFCCGKACGWAAFSRRRKEREQEAALF